MMLSESDGHGRCRERLLVDVLMHRRSHVKKIRGARTTRKARCVPSDQFLDAEDFQVLGAH
jgi:hypothetical protein